jgi:ferrous iron transport protein A
MRTLLQVETGKTVKFVRFQGGVSFQQKMLSLGLLPGDIARVIRHAPLNGPVLVEISGREFALGRGVAAKIEVEESSF